MRNGGKNKRSKRDLRIEIERLHRIKKKKKKEVKDRKKKKIVFFVIA